MKVSDQISIVDKIGRELQSRYTFDEIDLYLAEFGIKSIEGAWSSKWTYVKACLGGASKSIIVKIAEDLGLGSVKQIIANSLPPRNWENSQKFRLFVSHISTHKDKAIRLRDALSAYSISAFVAHEDIHPTVEWQSEIEKALFTMDAFVAIHTVGFAGSVWTQQEIGFALGRGVKIISLKMGEDPKGFISRHQALSRQRKNAEQVAQEIDELLAADPLTTEKLKSAKALGDGWDSGTDVPF